MNLLFTVVMKRLLLFSIVFSVTTFVVYCYQDVFNEELLIKPLPSGHVYTYFKFTVEDEAVAVAPNSFKHFRLFPRSLGEIISKHSVQELHFSLTQGLWRYEKWGYPYRDAPPGAELWSWFRKDVADVSLNWASLVNVLSGQFCSSLNFIDNTNTVVPKLSFRPQGAVTDDKLYNSSYLRYATLPSENVCTENLTPFKKLLPCDTKAGLATLLNAVNLFSAHFISLAVDFRTICKNVDCSSTAVELVQSVSVVFDQPVQQLGKQDWSFVKLFGMSLSNTCPVAKESHVYIDISTNKSGIPFSLTTEPTEMYLSNGSDVEQQFAVYDLKAMFEKTWQVNVGATYKKNHIYWLIRAPIVYASRYITGYGQERGGIQCRLYNSHPSMPLKIVYLDVIPWFLRIYFHTLEIKSNGKVIVPEYTFYKPAKDRERPYHIELVFTLPPKSTTEISLEFDYAFLKWTEYPPDANHGFYVGPAIVSTILDSSRNFTTLPGQTDERRSMKGHFIRLHTQILLVSLPTPDFSMPYNVICLACTVVALAFGPIHNVTTKCLQPEELNKEGFVTRIKTKVRKWWEKRKAMAVISDMSEKLEKVD